jgi:hypothetical protein
MSFDAGRHLFCNLWTVLYRSRRTRSFERSHALTSTCLVDHILNCSGEIPLKRTLFYWHAFTPRLIL